MLKKVAINVILVIGIVFALIGLYWLTQLGLPAGPGYLWLFVIGLIFVVIAVIAKLSGIDFWIEIPISKTTERSVLMLFLGMFSLVIIIMLSTITGLQFYSPFVMAPLSSFSLGIGTETFSALKAATSPFWTFFISVVSAPVIEELVLGFGFVLMGSLMLGWGLRKLLKIDFGEGNKTWDFVMSMIFSVVLFSVLHMFNSTYLDANGNLIVGMFMFAASFRLVLNILIYKFGNFGLLFAMGVHAINNLVALAKEYGWRLIVDAISSFPGGILMLVLGILLFIFAIMSVKDIIKEGKLVSKDLVTFE